MTLTTLTTLLGQIAVAAPTVLLLVLGLSALLGHRLHERTITRSVQAAILVGLLSSLAVLAVMLFTGQRHIVVALGDWVLIPQYHFSMKFMFDRLSVPFVVLSYVLCGTIAAFADKYMHREVGFHRFFTLYAVFLLGMVVASLAGTIETLFAGWELVGLSSALLVAFFHERRGPVQNGVRIWSIYRVADAALLLAALLLHHMIGEGDFDKLMGGSWPLGETLVSQQQALVVGLLLLVAAAGKSALVPFSGWLPRAMEGPTPSSAIFYGALSVHLGAFLLLRFGSLLEASPVLSGAIVAIGLVTALYGAVTARVQTDIKSALSFACLTQVGIIVAEIGLGFRYLALIHILGHACLRTLQFVRAPALLQDYRSLENALGTRLPQTGGWLRLVPTGFRLWLYRFGLERGYLDAWINDYLVLPVLRLFQWCDSLERRGTDLLARDGSRESDRVQPSAGLFEELL